MNRIKIFQYEFRPLFQLMFNLNFKFKNSNRIFELVLRKETGSYSKKLSTYNTHPLLLPTIMHYNVSISLDVSK